MNDFGLFAPLRELNPRGPRSLLAQAAVGAYAFRSLKLSWLKYR